MLNDYKFLANHPRKGSKMTLKIILPISLALSTDAFAVAVAKGTRARTRSVPEAIRIGAVFGIFEGGMCALGWSLASLFAEVIRSFDHWIALILLGGVGAKMIFDVLHDEDDDISLGHSPKPTSRLLWGLTALGTSIDSAAIGVAFALTSVSIWIAAPIIGFVSFAASALGFYIGPSLGTRFGKRAELMGGVVLIAIGLLIFISHEFGSSL